MPTQALLPLLLLCVLLLQAQGGVHKRRSTKKEMQRRLPQEINICEKPVDIHMCRRQCAYDKECQANNICCSTFCGNICMNIL
ncbi:WAP four-disulfide core domain protein 10A [Equus asinus]|uniref:WAP four-disulfide core domain protein 10A n=1 Tax=Equus asinus TaxID=9793 RepID=UPI0038F6F0E7